jgi:hypothetical protein
VPAQNKIFQFRLSLEGIHPEVWRRVQVPADFTLAQLHRVIQTVMDWQDYHLHEFRVTGRTYGDLESQEEVPGNDERTVRLRDLGISRGDHIQYVYDFGDDWQHLLELEDVVLSDTDNVAPLCLGGERSAPPEDVGGIPGYEDFLEAMADPSHEEHHNMKSWVGRPFDPAHFSTLEVNKRLRRKFGQQKTAAKTRTLAN